jgi:hypothetical protein
MLVSLGSGSVLRRRWPRNRSRCGHLQKGSCMAPDDNRDRERNKSNWRFIVVGMLALALIGLGIVYKYTGDFSGLATWGTNKQLTPR